MKGDRDMKWNMQFIEVALSAFLVICLVGCAGLTGDKPKATVQVNPAKVAISMDIFKTPIVFSGSGWTPGEVVSVDMVIPRDVKIPSLEPGEDAGVGFAKADEKGNFECKMEGMTKIITIFRGSMNAETFKPIGKTFKPIPFGSYSIRASGMDSGSVATTSIEFVKPPPEPAK
jgi:hypothetical protein